MDANKALRKFINEQLKRLDKKLKAAEFRSAQNHRKRREVLVDIALQTKIIEDLRNEFNHLNNRRDAQRLVNGKINPGLREMLIDMARQSEPMEEHLNYQNQVLDELIEDGKEYDRQIREVETEKQFYMKIKDNAKTSRILQANILNEM